MLDAETCTLGDVIHEAFPDAQDIFVQRLSARLLAEYGTLVVRSPHEVRVRRAILYEGPAVKYHRDVRARHRREWPALWEALDALVKSETDVSWLAPRLRTFFVTLLSKKITPSNISEQFDATLPESLALGLDPSVYDPWVTGSWGWWALKVLGA